MEFVTLPNDVPEQTPVANLMSADVTLDTDGRDRSFKGGSTPQKRVEAVNFPLEKKEEKRLKSDIR